MTDESPNVTDNSVATKSLLEAWKGYSAILILAGIREMEKVAAHCPPALETAGKKLLSEFGVTAAACVVEINLEKLKTTIIDAINGFKRLVSN
jgi:hypothetical protein